jgi:hypothetical protein
MLSAMCSAYTAPNDLISRIEHAESYPFSRPACSYLFEDGRMHPLPEDACQDRFPIVASGSNASPTRLFSKFGRDHDIPVTRAVLHDFAVVFAGHFTAYGAIPATLCPHPGAHTEAWITWLTPEQLTIMHRSEGVIGCRETMQRYDFVELCGIELQPERLAPVTHAGAYLSRRMLAPDGAPVRFAEVPASNTELRARSHNATLRLAAGLLEPETPYHAFMHRVLSTVDARQTLFEQLTPYTFERSNEFAPSMIEAGAVL